MEVTSFFYKTSFVIDDNYFFGGAVSSLFSVQTLWSLCLCGCCIVHPVTTETQRTLRLHRESQIRVLAIRHVSELRGRLRVEDDRRCRRESLLFWPCLRCRRAPRSDRDASPGQRPSLARVDARAEYQRQQ